MTNQEILKKAISIARDNGWEDGFSLWGNGGLAEAILTGAVRISVKDLIFDHEFAKALWGEKPIDKSDSAAGMSINFNTVPAWKEHLQAMVLVDDPIKYLGEHI